MKNRAKQFAHRAVKLAAALPDNSLGNHIRTQLIRSATSIAANYRAACIAHSKAGFVSKLSIVVEEADETSFWLEFVMDENLLQIKLVKPLWEEAQELTKIFFASRKTARNSRLSIVNSK
ncbi:MAG: four helix bundle protein [Sedimentisphaerales bacterium]|nr:four helix bundle protein [Sedimentisphaerales bacterium]